MVPKNTRVIRGCVDPTFKKRPKEKNIIACIHLARQLARKPDVLNLPAKRCKLFLTAKKDLVSFDAIERNAPAPNFSNLPEFEIRFRCRIFVYRYLSDYDCKEVYSSENSNLNCLRVNCLSLSANDHDIRYVI